MKIGKYQIDIVYSMGLSFPLLDHIADKLAGKKNWASGCGFGERVLSYAYSSEKKQLEAFNRLKKDKRFTVTKRTEKED